MRSARIALPRPRGPPEVAVEMLRAGRGEHWYPDIVDALLGAYEGAAAGDSA
jgi:HD-GYP domain-containing protein (c-di-GMP phosphodiesterase class II)